VGIKFVLIFAYNDGVSFEKSVGLVARQKKIM
jgi:hypothetical protein